MLTLATSFAKPRVSFSAPNGAPVSAPLTFTNETLKAITYLWDFGDGTTSTEFSPTHRYFGSGTYTVRLSAKDAKGKPAFKEKKITLLTNEHATAGRNGSRRPGPATRWPRRTGTAHGPALPAPPPAARRRSAR